MSHSIAVQQGSREVSGDSMLNDVGNYEAELLGQYWGPLLKQAALRQKLEVLVSPMYRTLQTAAPLMKYLHTHTQLSAQVYGQFFEAGGLFAPQDTLFMAEIDALVAKENAVVQQLQELQLSNPSIDAATLGKQTATLKQTYKTLKRRRVAKFRAHTFHQVGLTMHEMQTLHPWIDGFMGMDVEDLELDQYSARDHNRHHPWHTSHSDWNDRYINERLVKVADHLRHKAQHVPHDHIVVVVSHGDAIKRVLFNLLGLNLTKVTSNIQNTSCSMLTLPKEPNKAPIMFNFMNRTPHLINGPSGDSRNQTQYALDHGLLLFNSKDHQKTELGKFPRSFERPFERNTTRRTSKTVLFVRHGQAEHNQALESHYMSGDAVLNMYATKFYDSPLTKKGIQEAVQLSKRLRALKKTPELIVTSPLRRALETTSHAFAEIGQHVPHIVLEHWRERHGRFPCERRHTATEIGQRHGSFDVSRLMEHDELWQWEREPRAKSIERAEAALRWLFDRPEEHIAVVSHSNFLSKSLFTKKNAMVKMMDEGLLASFDTCECREIRITRCMDVDGTNERFEMALVGTSVKAVDQKEMDEDRRRELIGVENMKSLYKLSKEEIESRLVEIRTQCVGLEGPFDVAKVVERRRKRRSRL
tara:strand:+ start:304 stop:2229 length:1926 start_codon:yes stop_codon:yes gene_type:complete